MASLDYKVAELVRGIEKLEQERREAVADVYRYPYIESQSGKYSAMVKNIDLEIERKMNLINMLTRK